MKITSARERERSAKRARSLIDLIDGRVELIANSAAMLKTLPLCQTAVIITATIAGNLLIYLRQMPNTIAIIYRYRVRPLRELDKSFRLPIRAIFASLQNEMQESSCLNQERVYETPIHFRPYTSYISRRRLENPFPTISFDIANRMVSWLYGKFAELEKIAARSEYVDFIKRDKSTQATQAMWMIVTIILFYFTLSSFLSIS